MGVVFKTQQTMSHGTSIAEESGMKSCNFGTAKLGSLAPGNESRDFWRAHQIPVVPGLSNANGSA